MPFLAGPPGKEMPEWMSFIGHFHPLVLHLPIGVFILLVTQELGAIFFRRSGAVRAVGEFALFFGAATAVLAVLAGFFLYHGGGEDYAGNETAERHLWSGLVFAIAAILTYVVKIWTRPEGNAAWYRGLLFGSVGIMSFASHDGGTLTHGEGFLTKHAPPFLKKMLGEKVDPPPGQPVSPGETGAQPVVAQDPMVFAQVIAPILERRCVACHKEGKAKGKLRLDSYEAILKGGGDGPGIEIGKSASSLIIQRMELPLEDDERMPPKGKPQPEETELRVLKWWIDAGASKDQKLSATEIPAAIKADIVSLGGGRAHVATAAADEHSHGEEEAHGEEPKKQSAPDEQLKTMVGRLADEFPGSVTFESEGSDAVAFTAVGLREGLDDTSFAKFDPLMSHLVTADLSATKITDQSVALLADAKNLRMLRLAETAISDAAIDHLLNLPELESLNLYGTKVTDAAVVKLSGLPKLKRLFLWHTAVTPAGLAELKQKLPGCEIVTGVQ